LWDESADSAKLRVYSQLVDDLQILQSANAPGTPDAPVPRQSQVALPAVQAGANAEAEGGNEENQTRLRGLSRYFGLKRRRAGLVREHRVGLGGGRGVLEDQAT